MLREVRIEKFLRIRVPHTQKPLSMKNWRILTQNKKVQKSLFFRAHENGSILVRYRHKFSVGVTLWSQNWKFSPDSCSPYPKTPWVWKISAFWRKIKKFRKVYFLEHRNMVSFWWGTVTKMRLSRSNDFSSKKTKRHSLVHIPKHNISKNHENR